MTEMLDFKRFLFYFMDSLGGGRREEGRELLHSEAGQRVALRGGGGVRGYFGCRSVGGTGIRA